MNLKLIRNYAIIAISCLLIGRYVIQPKQQVKEVVKVVEVAKYVKEEKKKTKTEIKETVKPDGSKETTTVITEDSATKESGKKETQIDKTVEVKTGHGLTLGLLAIKNFQEPSRTDIGGVIAMPLIGNIKVIGFGATSPNKFQLGAGLGMEF